jgi:hypothetical protein
MSVVTLPMYPKSAERKLPGGVVPDSAKIERVRVRVRDVANA